MVIATSKKFKVPAEYLMAFMKNDSHYGTAWLATTTHNPGNVWNMDDGSTKDRWTREKGVDAVGDNLQKRIEVYQTKFGTTVYPTVAELAKGVSKGWIKFFGVYMTAKNWPAAVTTIKDDLAQAWITNQQEFLSAA
jgi:hypothetical protein